MLTTAGAARSTASAYEFMARGASDIGACTTGAAMAGGAAGAGAGCDGGAGERLVMSSGRTITAMNAAASPTIAETETKVRNRSRGRVDMSQVFLIGKRP